MVSPSKRTKVNEQDSYPAAKKCKPLKSYRNLYLETIDLKKLDFDLEKICSVTLSHLNVYCCLICGKYLQGRGGDTVAFLHSINENHHVYVNMETSKVYILPDDYEVDDVRYLESIKYAIFPTHRPQDIEHYPQSCYDLNNNHYMNGFVCLNNIKDCSYANVIILTMAHIPPLRNYLISKETKEDYGDELSRKLSTLVRKLWSPKLFRTHVSPYEFFQYLSILSKKAPILNILHNRKDPKDFISWILNFLCSSGNPEFKKLLLDNCRGEVEVTSTNVKEVKDESGTVVKFIKMEESKRSQITKFWNLSLNLPPKPLFNDGRDVNSWPQVKLSQLMEKFWGQKQQHSSNSIKTYKIVKLPPYLVLHMERFDLKTKLPVRNRNQTVIEFPLIMKMQGMKYRLIINIVHKAHLVRNSSDDEDKDDKSDWRIQVLEPRSDQWYEFQEKTVRLKEKEFLFLDESFLQVWERVI